MKITCKEKASKPTFGDVEVNQHFIDKKDYLCRKISENQAFNMASENSKPYSLIEKFEEDEEVKQILPEVEKITVDEKGRIHSVYKEEKDFLEYDEITEEGWYSVEGEDCRLLFLMKNEDDITKLRPFLVFDKRTEKIVGLTSHLWSNPNYGYKFVKLNDLQVVI